MPTGIYKRKPFTDETRRRISEARIGKKHSEKSKLKMSVARKLYWQSKEINRICSISGCGRKYAAKGYCATHYHTIILKGGYKYGELKDRRLGKCSVASCSKKAFARKYCKLHYDRVYRQKIPLELLCKPVGYFKSHSRPRPDLRGSLNPMWKGGVAEYPNHQEFKKNRLLIISKANGVCEVCRVNKIDHVHHKDGSKNNHALENLIGCCMECHHKLHTGRKNKKLK